MRYELLRLCNVNVSYGSHQVLRNLNVSVQRGETLGFVVGNDFEAAMLLDLLTGHRAHDSGFFLLEDQPLKLHTPREAVKNGILCRRGESQLIRKMSVEENIFLTCDEVYSHGFQNRKMIRLLCLELFEQFGIPELSPTTPVFHLDYFARFYIELIKLYVQKPKVLVIEFPGLDCHEGQCRLLALFFENCARQGIACVCAANKYLPVMKSCARVCLLNHGSINYIFDSDEETPRRIHSALFDNALGAAPGSMQPAQRDAGDCRFSVRDFRFAEDGFSLDFDLRAGEVLGVWDVQRRNTDQLVKLLCGEAPVRGRFSIAGKPLPLHSRREAMEKGFCIIDDTMHVDTVFYNMSLYDNIALLLSSDAYQIPGMVTTPVRRYVMRWALEKIGAEELIEQCPPAQMLPDMTRRIQMKIVVARMLCTAPRVILFVNPFNSYNETTIGDFRQILHTLRRMGIGVILWSFTQEYLLAESDTLITLEGDHPAQRTLRSVMQFEPFADLDVPREE